MPHHGSFLGNSKIDVQSRAGKNSFPRYDPGNGSRRSRDPRALPSGCRTLQEGSSEQALRQCFSTNLLLYNRLSKYKFKDDSLKLNQYLKEISSNDLNDLKQKFKENGLDYELFLEDIKIQFKWQTFIYKIYGRKMIINPRADCSFRSLKQKSPLSLSLFNLMV